MTDIWTIIVVGLFTLIGTIAGGIVTHILQQKSLSKQRKWELEDEARKTKRELVKERLDKVEEIIGLMVRVTDDAIEEVIGIITRENELGIREAKNRIGEMYSDAWTAVLITGSDELKENFNKISGIYWNMLEHGNVPQSQDKWDEIKDAQMAVIEAIDNMRALG